MQQISQYTNSLKEITKALTGKWERTSAGGATWVINGNIVLLEGKTDSFPFKVIKWHQVGSLSIAILGDPSEAGEEPESKDLEWVIEKVEQIEAKLKLSVEDLGNGRVRISLGE